MAFAELRLRVARRTALVAGVALVSAPAAHATPAAAGQAAPVAPAAAAAAAPAPAPAPTAPAPGDPDALIARGVELRREGKDQQALELFRSAQRLRPSPRAQAQVGLAEQALGRWVDAERDLGAALGASGDPWIAKNSPTLGEALALVAQHLGNLQVLGEPAGAAIKVDGQSVGALPMEGPVRVVSGEVVVSVSAPGYIDINRKLTVRAGAMTRESITLAAVQSPAAAGGATDGTMTVLAAPPGPPAAAGSPRLGTRRIAAIASAGAGVVGLALGTVFGLQAMSKHDDAVKVCPGQCADQHGVNLWNDARTAGNVSTIAFVAGALGVAGGVALWFTGGGARGEGRPQAKAQAQAQVSLGVGPGALQLRGAW